MKDSVWNWFRVRDTLRWIVWVLRSDNALLRYLHFYSFDVLIVLFSEDFVSPTQTTTTLKWYTTIVWELALVTRKGPLYRQLLWFSVSHRGLKVENKSSFYKFGTQRQASDWELLRSVPQWSIDIQKRRFPRIFFLWWTRTSLSHFIILSSPLLPLCIFILCFQCELFRLCAFQRGKVFSQTKKSLAGVKMEKGERQWKL